MNSPFFSIVMPVFNKGKDILGSIQSVINQTYGHFELLIINDGSTDNCIELVSSFSDPRIHLVNQQRMGVSEARNTGINTSQYKYIAFIDADDVWDSNYLEKMALLVSDFPDACLYACRFKIKNQRDQIIHTRNELVNNFRGIIPNFYEFNTIDPLFQTSGVIIKKSNTRTICGFDRTFRKGQDWDYWIRTASIGPIAYLNQPLITYQWTTQNRTTTQPIAKEHSFIWNTLAYQNTLFQTTPHAKCLVYLQLQKHLRAALTKSNFEVPTAKDMLELSLHLPNSDRPAYFKVLHWFPNTVSVPLLEVTRTILHNIKPIIILFFYLLGLSIRSQAESQSK